MKTEGQVRQQLKQVLFRHLQKELRELFRKTPESCKHNRPFQSTEDPNLMVQICGLRWDSDRILLGCDSRLDCLVQAQKCTLWVPIRDKETVKKEFHDLMESGDKGRIAARYPDAAALLWVLEGDVMPEVSEVEIEVDQQP